MRKSERILIMLVLCFTVVFAGCSKKNNDSGAGASGDANTAGQIIDQEPPAEPMEAQESATIEIGEDQEGAIAPNE